MQPDDTPLEPWLSFLNELDAALDVPTDLHCIGGFVVVSAYGMQRATADIDVVWVSSRTATTQLLEAAGKQSALRQKYGMYLDLVTVASVPEDYESRLTRLYPACWKNLNLHVLEPHDLALTKLERNLDRDWRDVEHLAKAGYLDAETLRTRYYYDELRPCVIGRESWHDQTLELWLESFFPPKAEPA